MRHCSCYNSFLQWLTSLCKLSLWPWYSIYFIFFTDENNDIWKVKPLFETYKYEWNIYFLLVYAFTNVTIYIVAYLTYTFASFHQNTDITIHDIIIIILRDLFITHFFYGLWNWILYGDHKYRKKILVKKYNSKYPSQSEWKRDRFWTTISTLISSLYEIIFLHYYHNKYFSYYTNYWQYLSYSLFWTLIIVYWKSFHFYLTHRLLHPWIKQYKWYDFGRILFNYIHSFHHEIINPSPWSGLSFNQIETILYYSSILFPWIFGIKQHFGHFLIAKYHSTITPLRGHDCYDFPGTGQSSYFHYLHHKYFNCNYGTEAVPMDKLFNTFQDGSNFK
eukprot:293599_1